MRLERIPAGISRRVRRLRSAIDVAWKQSSYLRVPEYRTVAENAAAYRGALHELNSRFRVSTAHAGTPSASVTVDESLPRLAWRGVLSGGHVAFTVGAFVERSAEGFYEGVWAGDFGDLAGAQSAHAYGSGAIVRHDGVTILAPKCMYEALFLLRSKTDGSTYIANSLCHGLAAAGIDAAFISGLSEALPRTADKQTAAGCYRYDPLITEDDRFALYALYVSDFNLLADGSLVFKPAPLAREFSSFTEYRAFIAKQIAALFANGSDPRRSRPVTPAVAVSRGYDSPAVAALAREAGCSTALCMDVQVREFDDSGVEIAKALGYDVNVHAHPLGAVVPRLATNLPTDMRDQSLEFIATTGLGDDLSFTTFEPSLEGTMLLTGSLGDSIWAKHCTLPPGLPVRVSYGKSMTEFRLRVGFAHVPVPTIGAFFPRSIARLSLSKEMRPYRIGGKYDRPIPRRIVEEAGVARTAFGIKKRAVNLTPLNGSEWREQAFHATMQRYRTPAS